MIQGKLETNGDHRGTLAVSLVRLSLSHHDQTSGVGRVRKARCLHQILPSVPLSSGHIWPLVTRATAASSFYNLNFKTAAYQNLEL